MDAYVKGAQAVVRRGFAYSPGPHTIHKGTKMAKTPRLRYHGVECTLEEIRTFLDGVWYSSNPAKYANPATYGKTKKDGRPWAPCIFKDEKFKKSKALPRFFELGFIRKDKKSGDVVCTEFGVRYVMSVARGNPHLRIGTTWKFNKRQQKRQRKLNPNT